jgi:hypothetical protein
MIKTAMVRAAYFLVSPHTEKNKKQDSQYTNSFHLINEAGVVSTILVTSTIFYDDARMELVTGQWSSQLSLS